MTITHDQKAAIGQAFLTELDRRISLREAAKKTLVNSTALEKYAAVEKDLETLLPKHTLGKVSNVSGYHDVDITLGKIELRNVPFPKVPAYRALHEQDKKNDDKRQKLCNELAFLHGLKGGSTVGAFQSYVARLWAPTSKDEVLPRSTFNTQFEAFADSKRGFTCAL